MTQKLNQVLAVERNVKSRVHSELTELHKASQKAALFDGFARKYKPRDDAQEQYPAENQIVQKKTQDVLKQTRKLLTELFDVVLTKDSANQNAKSNVIVDGVTVLQDVPATTLIFLEKQLTDIHTFVGKLPELDPSFSWTWDAPTSLWQSQEVITSKTKKVQKPLVLAQATEKHPAQAVQITEDEVVGNWTTVKHSGAMINSVKQDVLERIEKLQKAVKFAREQANSGEAPSKNMGERVFNFLLNPQAVMQTA